MIQKEEMNADGVEVAEIGIGLSALEFSFLCTSYSIASLICFDMPDENTATEEEQLQTLLNMVKRGILYRDGDSLAVNDEMAEILSCIAGRLFTLRIWAPESDTSNIGIYVGKEGDLVIAEPGRKSNDFVVLSHMPAGELTSYLASGDIIPEAMISEEVSLISRELEKEGISVPEGKLEAAAGLRLEIDFYEDMQAESFASLYVLWYEEKELIVRQIGENRTADLYITNELIPIICEICGMRP